MNMELEDISKDERISQSQIYLIALKFEVSTEQLACSSEDALLFLIRDIFQNFFLLGICLSLLFFTMYVTAMTC